MTLMLTTLLELGFLAVALVFVVLLFKEGRTHHRVITELYERLQQILIDQDRTRRKAELKILQALKGENYRGDIGGVEIYEDPAVPPGYVIPIPPKKVSP